jgi:hypothetical protein
MWLSWPTIVSAGRRFGPAQRVILFGKSDGPGPRGGIFPVRRQLIVSRLKRLKAQYAEDRGYDEDGAG